MSQNSRLSAKRRRHARFRLAFERLEDRLVPSGDLLWAHQLGSADIDQAYAVSADGSGVYVAGKADGALPGQAFAGRIDAFVARYDVAGNLLWVRQFGSTEFDYAYGVSADASGVYVVGETNGALPGQTSAGDFDAFVARYDAAGNLLWARQFGTASYDRVNGVSVNGSGVFVSGGTLGALPGQVNAGSFDALVAKFDASGNMMWARQLGSAEFDSAGGVSADGSGVYVTGGTSGALPGQTSAGDADAFVARYDPSGNLLWAHQFGSASYDGASDVSADGSGVYVAGGTQGALSGQANAGSLDAFVTRYDAAGNLHWVRQFGTAGFDSASGVSADGTGVYVAGDTFGVLPGQAAAGDGDAYVASYDAAGNLLWSRQFGSVDRDGANDVSADSTGIYVAGEVGGFKGPDSGGGALPGQISAGLTDAFVAKFRGNNVAPRLANVAVTPVIDENGVVTLSGDIIDPDVEDTFTLVVDWGEGSPQSFSYPAATTHFSETHQYLDDNPTGSPQDMFAISLTLTDDSAGETTATASTLVRNRAPVFTALGISTTSGAGPTEVEPVTISGALADVGTLDTHSATVDWGDGTVTPAGVTEASGLGSFSAQHTYQYGGIYPVLVTLRDDDSGEVSRSEAVFVTGIGIHEVAGRTSLQVVGTIGADRVTINQLGNGQIRVNANFLTERRRTLPLAGLDFIQVVLLAGDNRARIAGNVDLPAVLDGGDGNDVFNGGNSGSVLIGGRGNDRLNGGNSRDILIGGLGADRLVGNGGDDILIGGFTVYDYSADEDNPANDLALLRLLEEWDSERSYAKRVASLRDGVGPVLGGTGLRLQKGMTVFDDLDADILTGSAGLDWLFFDPFLDSLNGVHGGEETN